MKQNLKKPQLKKSPTLDSLFGLDNEKIISTLLIDSLIPFEKHPFYLYEGERLEDMVESIKTKGVLVPIIVRKTENNQSYEILAGHNRVNAARHAELIKVPAMVLEDISDEDAMAYVVETNLIQRSFSDMKHSEKAAVIALHHSKMFSQGKRNDILVILSEMEKQGINEPKTNESTTFHHNDKKLRSDQRVGEMYSLSSAMVSRYLRINKLIPQLKALLDDNAIAFVHAVTISFLTDEQQEHVAECLNPDTYGFSLTTEKANILRQYSKQGDLNDSRIYKIMSEVRQKNDKPATVKIKPDIYTRYFNEEQSVDEVQTIIEDALEMYFKSQNSMVNAYD